MREILKRLSLGAVALPIMIAASPAFADTAAVVGKLIELEDLFAQRSMAQSAETMTLIAWIQVAIGAITLAGIAWTLKYTRDTARSGQASANVAEKMLNSVERPYVFLFRVHGIKSNDNFGDYDFYIDYVIANHGKTPAVIESMSSSISLEDHVGMLEEVHSGHTTKHSPILPPGETREAAASCPYDPIHFKDVGDQWGSHEIAYPKTKHFFFRLVVHYRGPFTSGHETSACWSWDDKEHCLVPYGGEEYNYTR